jgi:tRNA-specific 2-thiouridylase
VKFDLLHRRAVALGFDVIATGHHARVARHDDGTRRVARGADPAKDQSYVLYMLDQAALGRTSFPVGAMTKADVRATAARLGLRTAAKPDSQDVCFIGATSGRAGFMADRLALTPGRIVDVDGAEVGAVDAIQLVTIGQRKGLGLAGGAAARYVVDIDRSQSTVTVGPPGLLHVAGQRLADVVWSSGPVAGEVLAQCSAHGPALPAAVDAGLLTWREPQRRVAPGQAVVLYDPASADEVLGGGTATDEVVPARR